MKARLQRVTVIGGSSFKHATGHDLACQAYSVQGRCGRLPARRHRRCSVEGDDRSRLHQMIDELSDEELPVARHLLDLLSRGLASTEHRAAAIANDDDDAGEDDDEGEVAEDPLSSPEMLAKLAQ